MLDDSRTVDLNLVPPAALIAEIRAAVDRWNWGRAARTLSCQQLCTGGLLIGHQKLLSARNKLDQGQENSLVAVVAGAFPTSGEVKTLEANRRAGVGKPESTRRSKKPKQSTLSGTRSSHVSRTVSHETGQRTTRTTRTTRSAGPQATSQSLKVRQEAKRRRAGAACRGTKASSHEVGSMPPKGLRCPVCFVHDPNYGHMWWECTLTARWRRQFHNEKGPPMVEAGCDERLWLGRGICQSALSPMFLAPACLSFQASWELEPPDGVLQHTVYIDGSAIHADMPAACRAGWGLAMIGPASATVVACAHSPLPLFT